MEQNKILDERASTPEDWEGYYSARGEVLHIPIDYNDFRNMPYKLVFEKIKEYFGGGSVLEVGAGDSDALIEVCKKLAPSSCFGLDYVETACDRLSNKAKSAGVGVDAGSPQHGGVEAKTLQPVLGERAGEGETHAPELAAE